MAETAAAVEEEAAERAEAATRAARAAASERAGLAAREAKEREAGGWGSEGAAAGSVGKAGKAEAGARAAGPVGGSGAGDSASTQTDRRAPSQSRHRRASSPWRCSSPARAVREPEVTCAAKAAVPISRMRCMGTGRREREAPRC